MLLQWHQDGQTGYHWLAIKPFLIIQHTPTPMDHLNVSLLPFIFQLTNYAVLSRRWPVSLACQIAASLVGNIVHIKSGPSAS